MKKAIFLLVILLSITCLPVSAQKKSDELKKNKKQIEAEIANTTKLLNQTKKNKNSSLQEISMLRKQIANREELITSLNNEIFDLEEELDLNIKLSQSLDKKLEYMKSDYSRVVYLAYKNRRMIDKITFLLASEDFSQMYRRFKYYSVFADNVQHQVDIIKQTKEEIERKNQEIVLLKEEKTVLLGGKEEEVKKLEIDRNDKTKIAEELKNKEKQLANELNNKKKRQKELDAAIKKAIQEEIRLANAKKAANNAKNTTTKSGTGSSSATSTTITLTPEEKILNNSFISNQGKLPWPVERGAKISDFGNYPHPDVPSVTIENRGIDILVDAGTVVRCVFDGEVTGVLDVLGTKVLMIRHGEYLTVYQNLTNVKVKKGDKVKTKQEIATVAKSSSNTYELHFEVWKNNNYLNPNSWLARR